MSLIAIKNLSFSYPSSAEAVFSNVSLNLDTDYRLALVGRNGRGKTTLLKLLCKELEYSGTISASVSFDYFPFSVPNQHDNALDIISSQSADCEVWKAQKELSLLDFSPDRLYTPFCFLSGGEQTKVLLSAIFCKDNNFLLIDEPTNHLDATGRELLSKYLSRKKGFIVVSHDRAFLDNCADKILSINRADIELTNGNFSSWLENKRLKDEFEMSENSKLEGEIARLKKASRRKADFSNMAEKQKFGSGAPDRGFVGHKSAKVMKSAIVLEKRQNKMIEQKQGLLKNIERVDKLKLTTLEHYSERLVSAKDLQISYGSDTVLSNLSFTLCGGDRLILCGKNGCGKSSVLRLIANSADKNMHHSGELTIASGLKISYVPQDFSALRGTIRELSLNEGIDEALFKTILAKLGFERTQLSCDTLELSDGQKKKVMLAKSLATPAHLYVWDEPLNYIDIFSRIQLEELICEYSPTMLLVEHDVAFTKSINAKSIFIE